MSLEEQLRELTTGLLCVSESEYPIEVVGAEDVTERNLILQKIIEAEASEVEDMPAGVMVTDLDTFFAAGVRVYDETNEQEVEFANRNRTLIEFLKNHCGAEVPVFKFGSKPEQDVYILGKINVGGYIILKTKVVIT